MNRTHAARSIGVMVLILSFCVAGCISGDPAPGVEQDDHVALATQFVVSVFAGDHETATGLMSQELKEALPPAAMTGLVQQITGQYGELESISGADDISGESYVAVHVTCLHATGSTIVYRAVFDEGNVAGFFIDDVVGPYTSPSYADLDSFAEIDVTIGTPGWELPAVLTMPVGDGPFPAVVLVQGSGPSDMDESVGVNKPFKDLAWGLASQGVAVLRYDKRTYIYGSAIADLIDSFTLREETIDDAVLALVFLSTQERVDPARIVVLGHSLGGYAAPLIAAESSVIDGIVLMAAPARPLEDLVVEQTQYLSMLDGEIDVQESVSIAVVESMAEKIRTLSLDEGELVLGASLAYWAYVSDYDPVATAAVLDMPLLALQGERDYQVTMEDFQLWQDGLGDMASFVSYVSLNHLMMSGSGPSGPEEYYAAAHVAADVITDIASWCKELE